jgi:multicomponent Na+:H+ antiporter subunit F
VSGVIDACLALLAFAGVLCLARLVRPGSVADRIVALDTFLVVTVSGVAVTALRVGGAFLDLVVVTCLVAFTGTLIAARYIEERGE